MQDQSTEQKLASAIEEAQKRLAADGVFASSDVASSLIQTLSTETPDKWAEMRDEIVLNWITRIVGRRIERSIEVRDTRQGWLALPEFEHVPHFIKIGGGWIDINRASLEQYRESKAALQARIESYNYARRSQEKAKRDKKTLKEMDRVERIATRYFAADPTMTMGRAIQLHQENLEAPPSDVRRRRKAAKSQTSTKAARA
jgi:hypothetical protein